MALKISIKPVSTDYGKHLVAKPITGTTSETKSIKGKIMPEEVKESQTIHKGVFTDGTMVTVEGSRTLNLGNYESARIGVTLTVPCDKNSVNDAYEFASNWVSEKIEEGVKIAKEV